MTERFILQRSGTRPNGWVLTDAENLVVIMFEEHRFNDTQRVEIIDNTRVTPFTLPRILREMSEWLAQNHYNKCF